MAEEIRITFYSVNMCGYYQRGKSTPEFGQFSDTILELAEWIKEKPLAGTCTFGPKESARCLPIYCSALTPGSSGSYLLTMWNKVPATGNAVASADGRSIVGQTEFAFSKVPEHNIAGYATYFWLLPSLNLLAAVTFDHQVNGHSGLNRYFYQFLTYCTSHAHLNTADKSADHVISGYKRTPLDPPERFLPRFRSVRKHHDTNLQIIRNNSADITKIIRRDNLEMHGQNRDTTFFKRVLVRFGIANPTPSVDDVSVKLELNYRPSPDEIEAIISSWQAESVECDIDVGFSMKGKGTVWLSGTIEREELHLDVQRKNAHVIDPTWLIEILESRKTFLLRNVQGVQV